MSRGYQNRGAFLSLYTYVFDLEADDRVALDFVRRVVVRDERLPLLGVLHVAGDLRVGDERLARADANLEADALDARDDSVEDFAFERAVDHGFEEDVEDGVAVVVDQALVDLLDPG